MVTEYDEIPQANTIYPSWLHVEYAITLFKSFWNAPDVAAKKDVIAPTNAISTSIFGAYSKRGEHLTIKNTPAVQSLALGPFLPYF